MHCYQHQFSIHLYGEWIVFNDVMVFNEVLCVVFTFCFEYEMRFKWVIVKLSLCLSFIRILAILQSPLHRSTHDTSLKTITTSLNTIHSPYKCMLNWCAFLQLFTFDLAPYSCTFHDSIIMANEVIIIVKGNRQAFQWYQYQELYYNTKRDINAQSWVAELFLRGLDRVQYSPKDFPITSLATSLDCFDFDFPPCSWLSFECVYASCILWHTFRRRSSILWQYTILHSA